MKMIARMFCAAALVLGALSLTGCGEKKDDAAAKKDTNTVQKAAEKAVDKAAEKAPAPEKK